MNLFGHANLLTQFAYQHNSLLINNRQNNSRQEISRQANSRQNNAMPIPKMLRRPWLTQKCKDIFFLAENHWRPLWKFQTFKSLFRKRLNAGTVPANKEYTAGTLPSNKEYAVGTLSNVCRCWLVMPLGAGVPHWVRACCTIEREQKSILHPPYCNNQK